MTAWEMVAVAAAGVAAGGINAVIGSGTLVSFPVLVGVGIPRVPATISNSLGLIAGNLTGSTGYRRELRGRWPLLLRLVPASVLGFLLREPLQRLNAIEDVLTLTVNSVAAGAYVVVATDRVVWSAARPLSAGSLTGGHVGTRYGRLLPEPVLRTAIVVLGVMAIGVLVSR